MKKIKVLLPLLLLLGLAYMTYISIIVPPTPPPIVTSSNPFVIRVENEIEKIGELPEAEVSIKYYNDVLNMIEEFAKPQMPDYPYGRYATTQFDNEQYIDNFKRNLYTQYVQKFINHSIFTFKQSSWSHSDVRNINDQISFLQKSPYLDRMSIVNTNLKGLIDIVSKYYEISDFIIRVRAFNFDGKGALINHSYPMDSVVVYTERINNYLSNKLENHYVNNCSRLHEELNYEKKLLFTKHVKYLENKIVFWSSTYTSINSQQIHDQSVLQPLGKQIAELKDNVYKESYINSEYERIKRLWDYEVTSASNYYRK